MFACQHHLPAAGRGVRRAHALRGSIQVVCSSTNTLKIISLRSTRDDSLGLIYEHGKGVEQDYKTAAEWYRLAANQGLAHAQNNLGMMYEHGKGVTQNDQLAFYWYKRAAEQALAEAEFNLSSMYKNGAGVKQDHKKAAEWRQRAVEQGHAAAQSTLGLMYAIGEGVPEDRVYAYMWIDIGASGSGEAQQMLTDLQNQIAQEMTPAQIAKAEELVQACIRKQYKGC